MLVEVLIIGCLVLFYARLTISRGVLVNGKASLIVQLYLDFMIQA